jgi:DnaJ-domain-containing protein 1
MEASGRIPSGTAGATEPPPLQSLFRAAEHGQNVCVLAVLTWAASCDGAIADDELELLRGVAAGVPGGEMLPVVIDTTQLGRPDDLEFACRYLRNKMDRSEKLLLARLLITMAAQDGHITVAENHVLRFMADLLGVAPRKFARLFEELTHRPFPDVGDVSSIEWWRRREAGEQAAAPPGGWGTDNHSAAAGGPVPGGPNGSQNRATAPPAARVRMTRDKALHMFGLEEGASAEEVHSAYRRLAKARHPDRFAGLGPAAQATATAAFKRVQEAYETLSASPTPATAAGTAR